MNKECCTDGIIYCHCRDGIDGFGSICSSCQGDGFSHCHCSKAEFLELFKSHISTNELNIDTLFIKVRREAYTILSERLKTDFRHIELACQKTYLDLHFLIPLIQNQFSKPIEGWPRIFFNDPRPFASQLSSWILILSDGFNKVLPAQFDLSLVFDILSELTKYDVYMKTTTQLSKNEKLIFILKASIFIYRYKETGLTESCLANKLYPLSLNDFNSLIEINNTI